MVNFFTSLGYLIILTLSLYGWGRMLSQRLLQHPSLGWAYHASLGIAIWICIGGILNLFTLAKAPALWVMVAMGWLFAWRIHHDAIVQTFAGDMLFYRLIDKLKSWMSGGRERLGQVALYLAVLLLLLFYVHALMPAEIFNHGDDFSTYMQMPVMILDSGTIGHFNRFTGIPTTTLGGQAFMQSLFVMAFDVMYINGFDVILCFFLGIFLIIELGKTLGASFVTRLLAVAIFVIYHPQYVNASALYSPALLFLGMTAAAIAWWRQVGAETSIMQMTKSNIPVAFFIAALMTLKTNITIYTVMFMAAFLVLGLFAASGRMKFFLSQTITGLIAFMLIVPWLLVFREKLAIFFQSFAGNGAENPSAGLLEAGDNASITDLFQNGHLFWGGWLYDYIACVVLILVAAAAGLYMLLKKRTAGAADLNILVPLTAVGLTTVVYYFIGPTVFPWGAETYDLVRYATSTHLAVAPLAPLIVHYIYSSIAGSSPRPTPILAAPTSPKVVLHGFQILTLVVIVMFFGEFQDRVEKMSAYGNMLSYPSGKDPKHIDHVKDLLSGTQQESLSAIQKKIPEGAKVLAWVATPFFLDYGRNDIHSMVGFATPWDNVPVGSDHEGFIGYLEQMGYEYVLWRYQGHRFNSMDTYNKALTSPVWGERYSARVGVYMIKNLQALANKRERLYFNRDEGIILFKVAK